MSNLLASTLLLGFAFTLTTYPEYAPSRGWPVGAWVANDKGWLRMITYALIPWAVISLAMHRFDLSLLWRVPVAVVAGVLVAMIVCNTFRRWAPPLAMIGCVICWAWTTLP